MRSPASAAVLLLVGLGAAACSAPVAPDGPAIDAADAAYLAGEISTQGSDVVAPAMSYTRDWGTTSGTVTTTWTQTRTCPAGGDVMVDGTIVRTRNRETRTGTIDIQATTTHRACAFTRGNGVTVTLDGDPGITMEATHRFVDGAPSGLQTLTQKGGFTFATSDGRSGSCAIDLVSTFDPATGTTTISGTSCDRTVSVVRTRTR